MAAQQRRSLSSRLARWGLVFVLLYALVALLTPLLVHVGLLSDPNAGLENPINAAPSWAHWCGTDRLGRDVGVRTLSGSGVALKVLAFLLGRGLPNAAAALCVVYVPQYFRVVRNQSAQVKAELYIEAAQSLGPARSGSLGATCCAT